MDIQNRIDIIKKNAYDRKIKLFSFLENYPFYFNDDDTQLSLNDYITNEILTLENNEDKQNNYTYWVNGGLSWYYWYNNMLTVPDLNIDVKNFDNTMSMSISNLKFNYIFNDMNLWNQKIIRLYEFVYYINRILDSYGFNCSIECSNFDYHVNPDGTQEFKSKQLDIKKPPFYNIKLVFNSYQSNEMDISGGATSPKTKKRGFTRSELKKRVLIATRKLKEQNKKNQSIIDREMLILENFKDKLKVATEFNIKTDEDMLKGKILLEFNLELYIPKNNISFDIQKFRNAYLAVNNNNPDIKLIAIKGYKNLPSIYTRQFLNRLNMVGLMTTTILNLSKAETKIEPESELSVDNIRQKIFINQLENLTEKQFDEIKKEIISMNLKLGGLLYNSQPTQFDKNYEDYKQNKSIILIEILEIMIILYNYTYSKIKNFNIFFTDRVNNIKHEYTCKYYVNFIDFIDRYFMTLFRPSVNAFVREINKELYATHKVKLFIAGGDSMRRYVYDSSKTADIDTKLHFKNAQSAPGKQQSKEEIVKSINDIVIKHTVNLRNYFEEYKKTNRVLGTIISEQNKGIKVFTVNDSTLPTGHPCNSYLDVSVDVLINVEKNYQFRNRKIDANKTLPVNLYSIDFRYPVDLTENKNKTITRRNEQHYKRQVALLDIVLSDDKDFDESDFVEVDGIAYASKKFLIKDLETTYNNDEMALGRLSNGKVEKDKIRYTELTNDTDVLHMFTHDARRLYSDAIKNFEEYAILRSDVKEAYDKFINNTNDRLKEIYNKIKLKNHLSKHDISYICSLDKRVIDSIPDELRYIKTLFLSIWNNDIIPRQAGLLLESGIKEQSNEIIPVLIKIKEKQELTIFDFFIIKDNFHKIKSNIRTLGYNDLGFLFEQIINFKINLPFEKLDKYDPHYQQFSEANVNDKENSIYKVFSYLCNTDLNNDEDENNFKHIISYAASSIEKILKSIDPNADFKTSVGNLGIVNTCIVPPQPILSEAEKKAERAAKAKATREANKKAAEKAAAERAAAEAQKAATASAARALRATKRQ